MIKITLLSISILFLLSCSFDDKTEFGKIVKMIIKYRKLKNLKERKFLKKKSLKRK